MSATDDLMCPPSEAGLMAALLRANERDDFRGMPCMVLAPYHSATCPQCKKEITQADLVAQERRRRDADDISLSFRSPEQVEMRRMRREMLYGPTCPHCATPLHYILPIFPR